MAELTPRCLRVPLLQRDTHTRLTDLIVDIVHGSLPHLTLRDFGRAVNDSLARGTLTAAYAHHWRLLVQHAPADDEEDMTVASSSPDATIAPTAAPTAAAASTLPLPHVAGERDAGTADGNCDGDERLLSFLPAFTGASVATGARLTCVIQVSPPDACDSGSGGGGGASGAHDS